MNLNIIIISNHADK